MSPLLFRCPATSGIINTEIETDKESIAACDGAMIVFCPHCRDWHKLPIRAAFIEI